MVTRALTIKREEERCACHIGAHMKKQTNRIVFVPLINMILNVSVRSFLFRILAVAFHIRVHNIVFHIVHYILAL